METLLETAMVKFYADLLEKTVSAQNESELNESIASVMKENMLGIDLDELNIYIDKTYRQIVSGFIYESDEGGFTPQITAENAEAILFCNALYTAAMKSIAAYMFQLGWKAKEAVMEGLDES
jgi:hypothetical protein